MKVRDLLIEKAISRLFHLTNMDSAADILQSGQFKLSASDGETDRARTDDATWEVDHYFLSMARSVQSGFFIDMLNHADVVLAISGDRLTQRHKIRPHADPRSREHFGSDYNEMEERLYSDRPVLEIPKPLNQTILAVHAMDILDQNVYNGIRNGYEKNRTVPKSLERLRAVCEQLNIPLITYKDFARFKMLRP